MELQFAGASSNLHIIRANNKVENDQFTNNEFFKVFQKNDYCLILVKGNRLWIGHDYRKTKLFKNHKIKLFENDLIYMFTDGYIDQTGGKNNSKYLISRFRNFLFGMQGLDMEAQRFALSNELESWKGNNNQIDDITVLGIKITSKSVFDNIELLISDKEYLQPFLIHLDKETIYNTGNILEILSKITSPSDIVQGWKDLLREVTYAFDEEKYNKLISIARIETGI
ncbi:MAG: SpoIIE family protein phosphatase [Bacteroidia bacterium]|nr:SpoIIE family protein phosphatase [Bacteroidia bacterium]